ncbi:endonuclease/exonuclease/phosphatase family protein [Luteococcus sp. OSA5]|uniref:endonuclease/exonuclease/phosphatase family protein n=1 Tax=Luteococcus sp. OSA5 TaxID=3401630 RepID=UPI003B42ADFF
MRTPPNVLLMAGALALAAPLTCLPAQASAPVEPAAQRVTKDVRFATFNASLNRGAQGELVHDLSTRDDAQAAAVAEIIQRTDADVILVNEFDFVAGGEAADLFRKNYLEVGQQGANPVHYPYSFVAPVNTGVPSGHDLNNDGTLGGPDDALGFGQFPGQYGMVVYSKHPIDQEQVRTFQHLRWASMPGALLPDDPATPEPADWYSPQELATMPLSSKSHWDVPIRIGRKTVHLLASHPTPPVFDGAEDRNGRRNHDEIRLWADYVTGGKQASWIVDDQGGRGGLKRGERFVIAGDQNANPFDGDSTKGAIDQLLDHPRVNTSLTPSSEGGVEASRLQGQVNDQHMAPAKYDTADFGDQIGSSGNMRADYVLPSRNLPMRDAGIFWPTSDDPLSRLTGTHPFPSSDHRLVWVDVRLPHHR